MTPQTIFDAIIAYAIIAAIFFWWLGKKGKQTKRNDANGNK